MQQHSRQHFKKQNLHDIQNKNHKEILMKIKTNLTTENNNQIKTKLITKPKRKLTFKFATKFCNVKSKQNKNKTKYTS